MFKRGTVHTYRNVGGKTGWVVILPGRLNVGRGKRGSMDEARHQADPNTIYNLD
jgi:hypothetical protein